MDIPTMSDIERYRNEKGSSVDAAKFYRYYDRTGWTIGGTPIRNWQRLFDKWTETEFKKPSKQNAVAKYAVNAKSFYDEGAYFDEHFDEIFARISKA